MRHRISLSVIFDQFPLDSYRTTANDFRKTGRCWKYNRTFWKF